jgi:hypothetical protein
MGMKPMSTSVFMSWTTIGMMILFYDKTNNQLIILIPNYFGASLFDNVYNISII